MYKSKFPLSRYLNLYCSNWHNRARKPQFVQAEGPVPDCASFLAHDKPYTAPLLAVKMCHLYVANTVTISPTQG